MGGGGGEDVGQRGRRDELVVAESDHCISGVWPTAFRRTSFGQLKA